MKPSVKQAMLDLIREAREAIPFRVSFEGHCEGRCDECPEKRLEFLDTELEYWEKRLQGDLVPTSGDLYLLARNCKEVYQILKNEGLIEKKEN